MKNQLSLAVPPPQGILLLGHPKDPGKGLRPLHTRFERLCRTSLNNGALPLHPSACRCLIPPGTMG